MIWLPRPHVFTSFNDFVNVGNFLHIFPKFLIDYSIILTYDIIHKCSTNT